MRRLATAVVLVAAAVVGTPAPVQASCVGPSISVTPTAVAAGGTVDVAGRAFGTDCNDTGGDGPPLGDPARDIDLTAEQGGQSHRLARVQADCDYAFSARVPVPADLEPGPAQVAADGALPVPVTILAGSGSTVVTVFAESDGPVDVVDCDAASTTRVRWIAAGVIAVAVALLVRRQRRRHRPPAAT